MTKKFVAVLLFLTVIIVGIINIANRKNTAVTELDCLKLGSDFRAKKCLETIAQLSPASTPRPMSPVSVRDLVLDDVNINNENLFGPQLKGILRNKSQEIITDFSIKVRFYKSSKTKTCTDQEDDSAIVTINSGRSILPGSSYAFIGNIKTNLDVNERKTFCYEIFKAVRR